MKVVYTGAFAVAATGVALYYSPALAVLVSVLGVLGTLAHCAIEDVIEDPDESIG